MTKEMHEKCLNKDMVIFGKLPKDVREEMQRGHKVEYLDVSMKWRMATTHTWADSNVYRIDPSTPCDPEFYEENVIIIGTHPCFGIKVTLGTMLLSGVLSAYNCLGIIYEKDGVETLRTSVDLAFGTPKRVRFAK